MSHKYAIVSDDETTVIEWRTYPNALDLATVKRLPSGRLKIRPVIESRQAVTALQNSVDVVTVGVDSVTVTNQVTEKTTDEKRLITNRAINQEILDLELANPITHRTQREFIIGISTAIAAAQGITAAQMLDPASPYYSHAYAAFVGVNEATVELRGQRV